MSATHATHQPPTTPAFIALLIAMSALSPLGINMYLPSMPGMARSLGVDFTTIQLTLSLYLAALALGQLIMGPLSDRFGRRPVLLFGLAGFVAGSLLCLAAESIGMLILGRIVQAFGGSAGVTLGRAVVRDLYRSDQIATMISYVTMGMAVAPMIAPTLGGGFDMLFGWRGSFVFLTGIGILCLYASFRRLHETNSQLRSNGSFSDLMRGYGALLRTRMFWGYALSTSLVSGVFFAFLAGAPYVTIELMGRSPAEYGLYFAMVPGGYILGNFLTGRLAGRIGGRRLMLIGVLLTIAGTVSMATAFAFGLLHPLSLFTPMFFIGVGNGLVLPSGIAGAVSVRPDLAGASAGLVGSMQIGFGALVAPIVGAVLGVDSWPLIAIMAGCALASLATLGLIGRKVSLDG